MKQRVLGRTGWRVSEIGYGAWQIGGLHHGFQTNEDDAQATIRAYIEAGGNLIDTATQYGDSERILGDYFRRNGGRDRAVICTKLHATDPQAIRVGVEQSLRRLKSDYVDIYMMHAPPDDLAEMNRAVDAYEQLKREGKVRAIGASIKGPNVTQRTVDLCRQYIRSGRIDVFMVIFSILRQKTGEMMKEAEQSGVGILARTTLESGFLSGKYAPGYVFAGDDHRKRWGEARLARLLAEVQDLKEWAVTPPYQTLAEVAIRFALDQQGVSSVVLGAKSSAQVTANVQAASLTSLPLDVRKRLIDTFIGRDEEFNTGQE
jgi:aryl-alcohol dehydrogenase-like predicted oxidoreductase